jgi:hypothetical protein
VADWCFLKKYTASFLRGRALEYERYPWRL